MVWGFKSAVFKVFISFMLLSSGFSFSPSHYHSVLFALKVWRREVSLIWYGLRLIGWVGRMQIQRAYSMFRDSNLIKVGVKTYRD